MTQPIAPEQKTYNELLMRLYEKNQEFLNKAIFTVSSAAIILLFKAISDEIIVSVRYTFCFTFIFFLLTIAFQIFSLKIARDGCDESLSNSTEKQINGEKLFKQAKYLDKWREAFFIFAMILVAVAFVIKTVNPEIMMPKKTQESNSSNQTVTKSFVTPTHAQNSFTPPTSSKPSKPTGSGNTGSDANSQSNQDSKK